MSQSCLQEDIKREQRDSPTSILLAIKAFSNAKNISIEEATQRIQLLEMQNKEQDERIINLQKLNDQLVSALTDISAPDQQKIKLQKDLENVKKNYELQLQEQGVVIKDLRTKIEIQRAQTSEQITKMERDKLILEKQMAGEADNAKRKLKELKDEKDQLANMLKENETIRKQSQENLKSNLEGKIRELEEIVESQKREEKKREGQLVGDTEKHIMSMKQIYENEKNVLSYRIAAILSEKKITEQLNEHHIKLLAEFKVNSQKQQEEWSTEHEKIRERLFQMEKTLLQKEAETLNLQAKLDSADLNQRQKDKAHEEEIKKLKNNCLDLQEEKGRAQVEMKKVQYLLQEKEVAMTDKHKQLQRQVMNEKKKSEHLQEAATRIRDDFAKKNSYVMQELLSKEEKLKKLNNQIQRSNKHSRNVNLNQNNTLNNSQNVNNLSSNSNITINTPIQNSNINISSIPINEENDNSRCSNYLSPTFMNSELSSLQNNNDGSSSDLNYLNNGSFSAISFSNISNALGSKQNLNNNSNININSSHNNRNNNLNSNMAYSNAVSLNYQSFNNQNFTPIDSSATEYPSSNLCQRQQQVECQTNNFINSTPQNSNSKPINMSGISSPFNNQSQQNIKIPNNSIGNRSSSLNYNPEPSQQQKTHTLNQINHLNSTSNSFLSPPLSTSNLESASIPLESRRPLSLNSPSSFFSPTDFSIQNNFFLSPQYSQQPSSSSQSQSMTPQGINNINNINNNNNTLKSQRGPSKNSLLNPTQLLLEVAKNKKQDIKNDFQNSIAPSLSKPSREPSPSNQSGGITERGGRSSSASQAAVGTIEKISQQRNVSFDLNNKGKKSQITLQDTNNGIANLQNPKELTNPRSQQHQDRVSFKNTFGGITIQKRQVSPETFQQIQDVQRIQTPRSICANEKNEQKENAKSSPIGLSAKRDITFGTPVADKDSRFLNLSSEENQFVAQNYELEQKQPQLNYESNQQQSQSNGNNGRQLQPSQQQQLTQIVTKPQPFGVKSTNTNPPSRTQSRSPSASEIQVQSKIKQILSNFKYNLPSSTPPTPTSSTMRQNEFFRQIREVVEAFPEISNQNSIIRKSLENQDLALALSGLRETIKQIKMHDVDRKDINNQITHIQNSSSQQNFKLMKNEQQQQPQGFQGQQVLQQQQQLQKTQIKQPLQTISPNFNNISKQQSQPQQQLDFKENELLKNSARFQAGETENIQPQKKANSARVQNIHQDVYYQNLSRLKNNISNNNSCKINNPFQFSNSNSYNQSNNNNNHLNSSNSTFNNTNNTFNNTNNTLNNCISSKSKRESSTSSIQLLNSSNINNTLNSSKRVGNGNITINTSNNCDSSQLLIYPTNGINSSNSHSRNPSATTTNANSQNINLLDKSRLGIQVTSKTPTNQIVRENNLNLNSLKSVSTTSFASKKFNALKDIIQY